MAELLLRKAGWLMVNFIENKFCLKFFRILWRNTVRDVMLHHDNAAPHKSAVVTEYLRKERVKLLLHLHPPYSPDLAPCDFYLFPKSRKNWVEEVSIMSKTCHVSFRQSLRMSLKRNITSHLICDGIG